MDDTEISTYEHRFLLALDALSAAEPKAQMHYFDHALSVVVNYFHIFDFSERNSTKLYREQDLDVLYKVCFFYGPIGKTRWPPWPMIDCDIFISY